jgi:PadR family transcriptional regulator PadR
LILRLHNAVDRTPNYPYAVVVKPKAAPQLILGEFEQQVLAAVLLLGENAYGMTIHEKVEEMRPRVATSIGAVYTTLDRLEKKGLVRSWYSDPTPERGGRSKRYFAMEGAGERALRESLERAVGMAIVLGYAGGVA